MNSRDVVCRTIRFLNPDRIAIAKGKNSDFLYITFTTSSRHFSDKPGTDEWGCVWKTSHSDQYKHGLVKEHPLSDWGKINNYEFPDPNLPERYAHIKNSIKNLKESSKFIIGNIGKGPMHLLNDIRGFENYLCDLISDPAKTEVLLTGIFGFLTGVVKNYAEFKLDAVYLFDDQAIQTGPIFSMDLWRIYFKPRYKKLFDFIHNSDMKVFLHTCGKIDSHLIDLYECGVDVIDNKQPSLWIDSEGVKKLRGKICYSTCIDIQSRIFDISIDEVEEEAGNMIRTLSVPEGGFIATYYEQQDLCLPQEKIVKMMQCFENFKW